MTEILGFLSIILGPLMALMYQAIPSYALTMIIFTILIRVVSLPLAIKQQKSTQNAGEQVLPAVRREQADEIDLVELFYLMWGHLLQIIACVMVGGAVAFAYTYFLVTPMYQATAKMYVVSSTTAFNVNNLSISSELTIDYQELLLSRPLLESVIEELELDMSSRQLAGMVSIGNPTDTRILSVTVTNPDPRLAADLANEIGQQAVVFLERVMETPPPNVYEEAIVPEQKSSPSYARNTLLGAMLLAVVYCGFLVVRYLMNDSFTTPEDIERYFGIQPLAVVPEGAFKSDKGRHSRKIADEQEPHKKA